MSTTTPDPPTVPDEVWQQLADRLAGAPTPPSARRSMTRRIVIMVVVLVLAGLAGYVAAAHLPQFDLPEPDGDLPPWAVVIVAVGFVTGMACLVTAFVRGGGVGGLSGINSEPTAGLRRADRRRVERMARGRAPAPAERVRLLAAIVDRRLRQSTAGLWFTLGFTLFESAQSLLNWPSWPGILHGVVCAAMLVMLLVLVRYRQQWRAFLQENRPRAGAEPTPPA